MKSIYDVVKASGKSPDIEDSKLPGAGIKQITLIL